MAASGKRRGRREESPSSGGGGRLACGPDQVGLGADAGEKKGEGPRKKNVPGPVPGEAPDPEEHGVGGGRGFEDAQNLDPLLLA